MRAIPVAVGEMPWTSESLCLSEGAPKHWFYPENNNRIETNPHVLNAQALCAKCPVRIECLHHGVDHEPYGVWGGATEKDREAIRHATGKPLQMIGTGGAWVRLVADAAPDVMHRFASTLYPAKRRGAA